MMRPTTRRTIGWLGIVYCAGALTAIGAQWLSSQASRASEDSVGAGGVSKGSPEPEPVEVRPAPAPPHEKPPAPTAGEVELEEDVRSRRLLLPVDGVEREQLRQSFADSRNGRSHEAIDIMAPRHTPVRAVDAGRIEKLFTSARGGLSIYQFDASERYCYYYAHLERYAHGLEEGQTVRPGQIVGYVGTSGNAPPDTPHLHFAIFALGPERRWWEGTPIDPYPALRGR